MNYHQGRKLLKEVFWWSFSCIQYHTELLQRKKEAKPKNAHVCVYKIIVVRTFENYEQDSC
jgi:hypothetical protein